MLEIYHEIYLLSEDAPTANARLRTFRRLIDQIIAMVRYISMFLSGALNLRLRCCLGEGCICALWF